MAWIRTQDKGELLNINGFSIEGPGVIGPGVERIFKIGGIMSADDSYWLGTFTERKSAMKELDCIQAWLSGDGPKMVCQVYEISADEEKEEPHA